MSRQERLAALNGESRVFVCHSCGHVKHIKDAGARVGPAGSIICLPCITARMHRLHEEFTDRLIHGALYGGLPPAWDSTAYNMAMARTRPFPFKKMVTFNTPT